MLPPQVTYHASWMLCLLTERNFIYYFNLTYSWLESLTLPTYYGYVTWALSGKIQLSFIVCSRQLTITSHISLYSLAYLLAYFGKLKFLSFLGAPSYGSHAEQAFIISHLNWRDTQLSRGAWCKTELGII